MEGAKCDRFAVVSQLAFLNTHVTALLKIVPQSHSRLFRLGSEKTVILFTAALVMRHKTFKHSNIKHEA